MNNSETVSLPDFDTVLKDFCYYGSTSVIEHLHVIMQGFMNSDLAELSDLGNIFYDYRRLIILLENMVAHKMLTD